MKVSCCIIDILPVLLFVLLFSGAKAIRPLHELNTEEYLSAETGKSYRGFFALVVILHHLAQRTVTGTVFQQFRYVGTLAVASFFFLSGYGLQRSYMTKGESYRKGFLLKRIPAVLIPYIIITAVYWLWDLANGQLYSLKDIVFSIVSGEPIALHSWYIINILIFYFVYWCLMRICGRRYFLMIILGAVWYILYADFCIKMGYGDWWYIASHLLIVGMFWAVYEKAILKILKKTYAAAAPVIWCLFLVVFIFRGRIAAGIHIPHISYIGISTLISLFTAMFFVFGVLMLGLKLRIGNKVLRFLGDISLEMYLSQGLFISALRGSFVYIKNDFLWSAAVLTCTTAFSYVLHILFRFLSEKYRMLCCNRSHI